MADYETLFFLALTALTLVLIGMGFIVYLMILGEREKNKNRAQMDSFSQIDVELACPHYFGYLTGNPPNEPIPDECFGCPKAVECMNGHKTKNTSLVADEDQE